MRAIAARLRRLAHAELHDLAGECYGMAMAQESGGWTREMVLALPEDGNRYELFDGQLLVTPAPLPRHQMAVQFSLGRHLSICKERRYRLVAGSPADLDLGGQQLSQPDLFVLPQRPQPRDLAGRSQSHSPHRGSLSKQPGETGSSNAAAFSSPGFRNTGSSISMPRSWSAGSPMRRGRRFSTSASNGIPPEHPLRWSSNCLRSLLRRGRLTNLRHSGSLSKEAAHQQPDH